ncbi:MAG: hypothetical protein CL930_06425 [Deltaproteobacteria bacterium]|nr:hypothetical protein [Deltaproteobacteria bacterium]
MSIPFARLGIPAPLRKSVGPDANRSAKIAVAKGLVPTTVDVQLALLYVLATDKDKSVAKVARKTLSGLPVNQVLSGISQNTFPKILEFIAQFRKDSPELDQRLLQLRSTPDRGAYIVAKRAGSELCESIVRNHERLLMTPKVFVALHGNPNCSDELIYAAESFLRMHDSLPEVPEKRPFAAAATPVETPEVSVKKAQKAPKKNALDDLFDDEPTSDDADGGESDLDLSTESVEPAAAPTPTPVPVVDTPSVPEPGLEMFNLDSMKSGELSGFSFDYDDDMQDFSWDLTKDVDEDSKKNISAAEEEEQHQSIEKKVRDMTVGQKIKLAYRGNIEVRKLLIRDANKIVATAVVKSGRLTPNEVASFAGNKNLASDVVREIATNKEFTRKYPVQVALANNPKTPVPVALRLMQGLHKKDLQALGNNRSVTGAVFGAAQKMFKEKYRK